MPDKKRLIKDSVITLILLPIAAVITELSLFPAVLPLAFLILLLPAHNTAVHGDLMGALSFVLLFLVFFLIGAKPVAYNALFIIPVSAACGLFVRRQTPFGEGMTYTCLAFAAGIACAVLLAQATIGGSIGENVYELLKNGCTNESSGLILLFSMALMAANGFAVPGEAASAELYGLVESGDFAVMREKIEAASDELCRFFDTLTPIFAVDVIIIGGVLLYICTRALAKKHGREVCPAPVLADYALPEKTGNAFFTMFLAGVFIPIFGFENTEMFCLVLTDAMKLIFALQGIAFTDWVISRYIPGKLPAVLSVVIALLLGSYMGYIGMLEQIFGIRKKIGRDGFSDAQ